MENYYLDIETTGLNPEESKILTIQFQELDFKTGEPSGKLIILKSWESSEEGILREFSKKLNSINKWDFVAHGYNLKFEHDFLLVRGKKYGLVLNLFNMPTVDLHPIGILMNQGNFVGSGLNKISGKKGDGILVLEMYASEDYKGIEEYIKQEAREYLKLYVWLRKKMPELLKEYKGIN